MQMSKGLIMFDKIVWYISPSPTEERRERGGWRWVSRGVGPVASCVTVHVPSSAWVASSARRARRERWQEAALDER